MYSAAFKLNSAAVDNSSTRHWTQHQEATVANNLASSQMSDEFLFCISEEHVDISNGLLILALHFLNYVSHSLAY